MGSIGVVVDTTVEYSGSVLSNSGVDHSLSAGVVVDERGNIMNNAGNKDKSASVASLLLVLLKFHDRELLQRNTPVQGGTLAVKLLLLLLKTTLLNFVLTELFQVIGEAELFPDPDSPLGGIIYDTLLVDD